jgi:hypothetical protein
LGGEGKIYPKGKAEKKATKNENQQICDEHKEFDHLIAGAVNHFCCNFIEELFIEFFLLIILNLLAKM